uniref:protein AKNAD1 n=1 Tax=Lonchura striata TaxID=40157 RepID=UPI000B4C6A63|nr:protein AKNAD1 [Lonchura striata domestica]
MPLAAEPKAARSTALRSRLQGDRGSPRRARARPAFVRPGRPAAAAPGTALHSQHAAPLGAPFWHPALPAAPLTCVPGRRGCEGPAGLRAAGGAASGRVCVRRAGGAVRGGEPRPPTRSRCSNPPIAAARARPRGRGRQRPARPHHPHGPMAAAGGPRRAGTNGTAALLRRDPQESEAASSPLPPRATADKPEEFSSHHRGTRGTTGVPIEMPGNEASFQKELPVGSSSKPDSKEHVTTSKMSKVLLCHFPREELLSTCHLIECETIPEVSFTESIDDTGSKPEPSEHSKGSLVYEQWAASSEEYPLEKHKEVKACDKDGNLLNGNRSVSNKPIFSSGQCGCRQEYSQLINETGDTHTFQNMKDERTLFKRTVSPCELKYGQGQAHYCLPDFSEVASQVQVPKKPDNITSVPSTERAKPFPVLQSKSVTVNNTLENKNYFNSAEVENQEERSISELLQQLQMLTQHADIQNHIDHLRFNPKILPLSDFANANTAISSGHTGTSPDIIALRAPVPVQPTHSLLKARLQPGTAASALPAAGTVKAQYLNPSDSLPELTLGEKMSQILKDQTEQLTKKVEDFSKHMIQETLFLQDKYLALNQLKGYLDALERNYLKAREEHHNLQLQNYKDKPINLGEFDPERRVEGGIFRLGMLLEDIQEQMDGSKGSLSSLLTSYESAQSFCESLAVSGTADLPQTRGTETLFFHKKHNRERSQTTDVILPANQLSLEGKKCNLCLHINTNMQEGKTGTSPLFVQRKPTDLSDTNLSSNSEDFLAFDSYNSQSKDLVNCDRLRCRCPTGSRAQVKLRNYKESVQSCTLCRKSSSSSSCKYDV